MTDIVAGFLEVGLNEQDEIVVNHPNIQPDPSGAGHIVFSRSQARHLAHLLLKHATESEQNHRRKQEEEQRRAAEAIPVDREARVLTDGSLETPDHREINPATGQQKGYVVLTAEERAKGFVRPVRRSYIHKPCGTLTTMATSIAETYARDPKFYGGTFCCGCKTHYPLDQFVWEGTDEQVGS